MALPVLTPEQRTQALAKAAEARKKRAELKGELKSGKRTLKDVLARSGDDIVGKMKVSNVLESLPGVGKVRAQKLMEEQKLDAIFMEGKEFYYTPAEADYIRKAYALCKNISIDYGIMEKASDVAVIPLHYQVNTWAARKGLSYKARSDEFTLATDVSEP